LPPGRESRDAMRYVRGRYFRSRYFWVVISGRE
jgi:hypothetical protein